MSTVGEDLKACADFPALQSMIEGRLYPQMPGGLAKGGARPAITFQLVSRVPSSTMEGTGDSNASRYQFNLYGRNPLECEALFIAFRDALKAELPWKHFIGQLRDLGDPETKVICMTVDVQIWHAVPIAA